MRISVVTPSSLGSAEVARWRSLQESSRRLDNPFLSPSFARHVGAVTPEARVAVFEEGNELVAFFPFRRGTLRCAKPLAAGIADCQGIVHVPGFEWDPKQLLRAAGLESLEFDHLLGDQLPPAARRAERADSPVIDVSEGFESYLRARRKVAKGIISALERKRRKLERESSSWHLEVDDRRPEVLAQLMRWKSAQYRRTGRTDRFARSWVRSLVLGLFDSDDPGCAGRLISLDADGRTIAALFALTSSSVLASWFPGYDPEHGRYSPGLLLFLAAAEHAAAEHAAAEHAAAEHAAAEHAAAEHAAAEHAAAEHAAAEHAAAERAPAQRAPAQHAAEARLGERARLPCRFDLGKGDEDYKRVLGNDAVEVAAGRIDLGTPCAFARRLQVAPGHAAIKLVVSSPPLRSVARRALRGVGRLRRAPA